MPVYPKLLAAVGLAAMFALLPADAVAQATPAQPCGAFYVTQDGDTLDRLARRCGVTIPALLAANPGVRVNQDLQAGSQLRIPPMDAPQPRPQQACGAFYTVRGGESLEDIAARCGLTVPLLLAANGPLPEPMRLEAGRVLRIPDLPAVASQAAVWTAPLPADTLDGVEPDTVAPTPLTRLRGTLAAGDPCMRLRADDGRVYALDGRLGRSWRAGDAVVVQGLPGDPARCGGHEPTLEVRIVHRPG